MSVKAFHINSIKFCIAGRFIGIYQWPMDSSHKGPVMKKVFSCHDVIMLPGFLGLARLSLYSSNTSLCKTKPSKLTQMTTLTIAARIRSRGGPTGSVSSSSRNGVLLGSENEQGQGIVFQQPFKASRLKWARWRSQPGRASKELRKKQLMQSL